MKYYPLSFYPPKLQDDTAYTARKMKIDSELHVAQIISHHYALFRLPFPKRHSMPWLSFTAFLGIH